ncbi:XylR family transcriptional regulator [Coraliomargarita sp. SDUM461004]|uniref:XylR family transcriptional regulator n=1 Tax=Thalassobacterium sedimentorum TaxID=3041258 RepID=A0ABU1AM63_9BACT|nr:XylR family transcriptional regulator [Coraliomargarita sp. SDUM461004]MDQ8195802.1 XylR family transcriptional regulator [Coraliomargarita sp. SDUM461004]
MPRIAILVETSLASGRQILAGISHFLKQRNDISVFHHSGQLGQMHPDSLIDWQGDGIIARVVDASVAKLLIETGLPTVDVLGNVPDCGFPLVKTNNDTIGSIVAEHFIQNGFHHFGLIGLGKENWSLEREAAFFKSANEISTTPHSLHLKSTDSEIVHISHSLAAIRDWLPKLPKPIGVLVTSDQFAPLLFQAAHELELRIPEDISIVGVDNDAPYCDLCRPALSSVDPNHEEVGYQAARLLEGLLTGAVTHPQNITVRPHMIHLRRSSSFLAVNDPQLSKAMEFIRIKACKGISVDEIAQHCGLSRSVLQRRFRSQINRSVGDCILNEKLTRAKELIYAGNLSMNHIAELSGLNSQEYMSQVFRKHLHQSPKEFKARLPHTFSTHSAQIE